MKTAMILDCITLSAGLRAIYSVVTANPGPNTTPQALAKLLAKMAQEEFYRLVAATVGMFGSCFYMKDTVAKLAPPQLIVQYILWCQKLFVHTSTSLII